MTQLIDLFAANLARNGMVVHRGQRPTVDGAVESEAAYGLADPGSVVMVASPSQSRAESLLPDVHVAVITEDRVLPGLAELLAELEGRLPSGLVIISGPSRSADIEQQLVTGVHGPKEQHVAILPPAGS